MIFLLYLIKISPCLKSYSKTSASGHFEVTNTRVLLINYNLNTEKYFKHTVWKKNEQVEKKIMILEVGKNVTKFAWKYIPCHGEK